MIAFIDVEDSARYAPYAASVPDTIAAFGGRYLVRNGTKQLMEGALPAQRLAVIEFPSVERAKEWYASDAYQVILPIRASSSRGTVLIVEGYGEAS